MNEGLPQTLVQRHRRLVGALGVLGVLAFPVLLFAFSTMFFMGDLGKWNDDYFLTTIDPATGDYSTLIKTTREPFQAPAGRLLAWRPLHLSLTPTMLTLLWDHPRVIHFIGFALHGGACVLLYRLLRALHTSRRAAAGATILFMVWASHYEVVLWASAFSTGAATCCLLGASLLYIRLVRRAFSWFTLVPMLLLAAAVPCFNEQPAGAFAALPLAALAAVPWREFDRRRVVRAILGYAAIGTLCATYMILPRLLDPPGYGNSADTLTPLHRLPASTWKAVVSMGAELMMTKVWPGALYQGVIELGANLAVAGAWIAAAILCAWAGLSAWTLPLPEGGARGGFFRCTAQESHVPLSMSVPPSNDRDAIARGWGDEPSRHAWAVAAYGAAMFLFACLPIAMVNYSPNSRTSYVPALAMLVFLAGTCDFAGHYLGSVRLLRPARLATAAPILIAALVGGLMLVGVQSRMRNSVKDGLREAAQLKALVPNPAPGTVFVPLRVSNTPIKSGSASFDGGTPNTWDFSWSSLWFLKFIYQRNDVHCTYFSHGIQPIGVVNQESLQFESRLDIPYEVGKWNSVIIPWDKIIVFTVDQEGRVAVVTRVAFRHNSATWLDIIVPQTRGAVEAGALPPYTFVFPPYKK